MTLFVLPCAAAVGGAAAAQNDQATLDLQPLVTDHKAEMHVVEHLPQNFLSGGQTLTLALATMAPAYQRTTDTVEALVAEDDQGRLPLIGPKREGQEDVWRAGRAVRGAITLRYVLPAAPDDVPHHGPITYLQHTGKGLSGSFASFLLAPRSTRSIKIAVRWRLLSGDAAVSNAHVGDFARRTTFSELSSTLFVVGPLVHAPDRLSDDTLVVAGLARPQDEVERARQWFAQAFAAMRGAFHDSNADGYRVMFFSHDRQSFDSGTSRKGGFLYFLPADARLDDRKNHSIIAHEMVHSLALPYQEDTDGPGDWYNEGIADYAAIIVPNGAGLYAAREYLALVNKEAATYYLNPLRLAPNAQISAVKWSSNKAWSLGYGRGALYFANLDAELRAHGSKTTVIDLIRRMSALAVRKPIGPADWEKLLRQSVGPWAVQQWRGMLAGNLLRPVPGAFGKCLVAKQFSAGHYDLGFTRGSLRKGERIAHVRPGSNAFKAGLRDGDTFRETFDDHGIDSDYDRHATLSVIRGRKPLDITYLPRAGAEPGYRWFARSGDPDHPCR